MAAQFKAHFDHSYAVSLQQRTDCVPGAYSFPTTAYEADSSTPILQRQKLRPRLSNVQQVTYLLNWDSDLDEILCFFHPLSSPHLACSKNPVQKLWEQDLVLLNPGGKRRTRGKWDLKRGCWKKQGTEGPRTGGRMCVCPTFIVQPFLCCYFYDGILQGTFQQLF